jgi:hypothetical protein
MSLNHQLAGFADENGDLGRAVPAGQIRIPRETWLEGDSLCWRMGEEPPMREVPRTMLTRFVQLSDADSILSFARQWGVLSIASQPTSNWYAIQQGVSQTYFPGRFITSGKEPIAAWLFYARRARALLNIGAALKQGKLGDMSDWAEFARFFSKTTDPAKLDFSVSKEHLLYGLGPSLIGTLDTAEDRLARARGRLTEEITAWFTLWRAGGEEHRYLPDFSLVWDEETERWDLRIDYWGFLFPAIAMQLALILADADSLYNCSGCGTPYIRPRDRKRPKAGWANYCGECSKAGVAQRRAVESYREKRKEAMRLHAGGSSVSDIAEQLNTEPGRIHGWLAKGVKDGKAKARK